MTQRADRSGLLGAEKHFPVLTGDVHSDTRKIMAVGNLQKEWVRRGRSEHAPSEDCQLMASKFEY